jgi:adenylosuccinate lyase
LKALTRGQTIDGAQLKTFIEQLPIPAEQKIRLLQLMPTTYLGNAVEQAKNI